MNTSLTSHQVLSVTLERGWTWFCCFSLFLADLKLERASLTLRERDNFVPVWQAMEREERGKETQKIPNHGWGATTFVTTLVA